MHISSNQSDRTPHNHVTNIICFWFLYTAKVTLTMENALHMMYVAKKYMMTGLEHRCTDYVLDNITAGTVCTILTQSVLFSNDDLRDK